MFVCVYILHKFCILYIGNHKKYIGKFGLFTHISIFVDLKNTKTSLLGIKPYFKRKMAKINEDRFVYMNM